MLASCSVFRRRLLAWYAAHRRDLPWRVAPGAVSGALPDPYHVMVSEAMLQQTQVATVIPYFHRFIAALPGLPDLAGAREELVLRLWQGLGYYTRARNLHRAAQAVMERHGGVIPDTVTELLELPGVGRYTAGAIASLAYGRRAPILDGNVIRVLARLDCMGEDPRKPAIRAALWERAGELLPRGNIADFNSALMELGATVCTARAPRCESCPVRKHCAARSAGLQEEIPPAAPAKQRALERRWTICIRRDGRWLIEQRPESGRWANLWQFPTIEAGDGAPTAGVVHRHAAVRVGAVEPMGMIGHDLTHRRYQFNIFLCQAKAGHPAGDDPGRAWVELSRLGDYPLPRPHLRIAAMLAAVGG